MEEKKEEPILSDNIVQDEGNKNKEDLIDINFEEKKNSEEEHQEEAKEVNPEIPKEVQVNQSSPDMPSKDVKTKPKHTEESKVNPSKQKPKKMTSAKAPKEVKPKKESIYDKALKQCGLGVKEKKKTVTSGKGSPVSNSQMDSLINPDQRALFLQLKDSLLEIQKKDAVTRQLLEKLQKEKRSLEDDRIRKKNLIAKCEKSKTTDGSTIDRKSVV